ncbi:hypothetical protein CHCC20335_1854 [Bacillus paralicheniformis]|nr:hypothetical protein CHCC20335_1854 [Bacillus paralicheniformis]
MDDETHIYHPFCFQSCFLMYEEESWIGVKKQKSNERIPSLLLINQKCR